MSLCPSCNADAGDVADGGSGKGYTLGAVAPVAGFSVGFHYANNTDDLAKIKSWEVFVNKEIFKTTYGRRGDPISSADGCPALPSDFPTLCV